MARFIFMLTENDATIEGALAAYESIRGCPVQCVGFKDIGLPVAGLRTLGRCIRADGRTAFLEIVATSRATELASVEAALDIGVDYLLGGRHVDDVLPLLRGSGIRYFPFAGRTAGHPTVLQGSVEEIVADACRLAGLPGVDGLDLLAYRLAGEGDPGELTRRVVAATGVPVIAAGSIDCAGRVEAMIDAGAWGFTVGGAIFRGAFGASHLPARLDIVLGIRGVSA